MGGSGLSLAGAGDIDVTNPAGLSHITRAMLAIDGTYEGFSATDDRTSAYLSRTSFGGASLALPIAPSRGVTFAMGLVPVSRVNYNIVSPDTLGGSPTRCSTWAREGSRARSFPSRRRR